MIIEKLIEHFKNSIIEAYNESNEPLYRNNMVNSTLCTG